MSHIFTARMQPATNYVDRMNGFSMRFRCTPRALLTCWRCRKQHRAENMLVQVFYDSIRHWCKDKECHKK